MTKPMFRAFIRARLLPVDQLDPREVERGLVAGYLESASTHVMFSLIGGAFLSGWALQQGASMTYVGLLNAAGAAAVIVQLPAIWLAARYPRRKLLCSSTQALGRLMWLVIALLPLVIVSPERILSVTLVALYASFLLMNLGGPAWTAWIRDFVPEDRMGRHLGRRISIGLIVGSAFGLLGGLLVDAVKDVRVQGLGVYNLIFALGALAGLAGIGFALFQPEPRAEPDPSRFARLVTDPLRDLNFRRYIHFMLAWGLAGFLALPFTTAYMLKRLNMDMSWVVGMVLLSQVMTALFMPMWGRLSDRFTSKSVLSVTCPMFLLPYPVWILAANVEPGAIRYGLVIALHMVFGLANGGMMVATGNLLMKFAPRGRAAAYAGLNGTTMGVAAIVSPWLGGKLADQLAGVELAFSLTLNTPSAERLLPVIRLAGLDYIFLAALAGGLYGWHRLLAVKETGEVEEPIILNAVISEVWSGFRLAGHHARRGIRHVTTSPWRRFTEP